MMEKLRPGVEEINTSESKTPRTKRDKIFLGAEAAVGLLTAVYALSTVVLLAKGEFSDTPMEALNTARMTLITAGIIAVDRLSRKD